MQVVAGRQAGGADIADHLALADARAGHDALGEGALVIVGGLVAVGVADDRLAAIAARPARLLDHAVARGDDRRAARRRPVDAGMHAAVAQDRMAAHAEAGPELAVRHRIAQQELARALAVRIEIVDRAIRHLEAVIGAHVAAERRLHIKKLRFGGRLVLGVGIGEEDLQLVGRIEARLVVDLRGEQLDELLRHPVRQPVGICGAVDAVVDGRQVAAHAHRSLLAERRQQFRIDLRFIGHDVLAAIVDGDGQDVLLAVVDGAAHDVALLADGLDAQANDVARLQLLGVEELRDRLGHAHAVLAFIAGLGEGVSDLAVGREGNEILRILDDRLAARIARCNGDVFLHDLDPVGRERLGGEGLAETLRIDIVKRGDLDVAVGEDGGRRADHLLDLVGGQAALLVERGGVEREVHDLEADLALHLGAVDKTGGRGLRRRAILGENHQRIESGVAAARLVACGERHLDLDEGHGADDVAVALLDDGRDLHAPLVLGARDGARRNEAGRLRGFAGDLVIERCEVGDFGRCRELLAAVQRGRKRDAHQDRRGDAGQERAREPARGNLALVRRSVATVPGQRRLLAKRCNR